MEQHHPGGLWLCQGGCSTQGVPTESPLIASGPPLAGRLGMNTAFCVSAGGTLKDRHLKITPGTASGHKLASTTITQEGKEEKIRCIFFNF